VHNDGKVRVGNKSTISGSRIYSGESRSVIIGQDCMFSSNIDIRTTDSHSILSLESKKRINTAGDIKVGNHVWLGNGCKLLKGANIGDNCVIGMGSTVTKAVKSNSLAVGIPAKVIEAH
jgi:acetyltransferase-like isoleucine patch superfamily enzyme